MLTRSSSRVILGLALGVVLASAFLLLEGVPQPAGANAGTLFVTATGSGSACSQAQPCALRTALAQAAHGNAVYVAGGLYTGTGSAVVTITRSIMLYGGWDGAATGPVARDPAAYPTILHGQGARRVVYINGYITPTLDGLTITGGNAANAPQDRGMGGGILSSYASPVIQNNIIISNAGSITPTSGAGGGVYLYCASATTIISGNRIVSNTAMIGGAGSGGGLFLSNSNATLSNNLVANNTASFYGGGVYIFYGAPRLIGNEIVNNVAGRNSGGLYTIMASPLIQGNLIAGNRAGWDGSNWNGGGVLIVYGSPVVTANRIVGNAAASSGGLGVETGSPYTVTNNIIVRNSSEGIMVWEFPGYGLIAHNTIAYNGGMGGIWLAYPSVTPTIVSNIIVSNTYGIAMHSGAWGVLDYNDVWGNTSQDYVLPVGLGPGPHSIQADPKFADPPGDDYHLRLASPCIDVGPDVGVATDIEGDRRPIGFGYDLGADECRISMIHLPLVVQTRP